MKTVLLKLLLLPLALVLVGAGPRPEKFQVYVRVQNPEKGGMMKARLNLKAMIAMLIARRGMVLEVEGTEWEGQWNWNIAGARQEADTTHEIKKMTEHLGGTVLGAEVWTTAPPPQDDPDFKGLTLYTIRFSVPLDSDARDLDSLLAEGFSRELQALVLEKSGLKDSTDSPRAIQARVLQTDIPRISLKNSSLNWESRCRIIFETF